MASNASAISLSIPEITEESNQETDGVWAKLTARFTNGEFVELTQNVARFGRNSLSENMNGFKFAHDYPTVPIALISKIHFIITRKEDKSGKLNMNPPVLMCCSRNGIMINNDKLNSGDARILLDRDLIKLSEDIPLFRFRDMRKIADYFPSRILQKYFIGEILGKGAYGQVRVIHEKKTLAKLAMKTVTIKLDENGSPDKAKQSRAKWEINIMKEVNHPNLMTLIDESESFNQMFLLMDLMDFDLLEFIRTFPDAYMPEFEAKFYFYQICNGTEYLHQKNIVHRDIKPENIFLKRHPLFADGFQLRIGDFGLSKQDLSGEFSSQVGTVYYVAPEVIALLNENNHQKMPYTTQVDVWSLGCVLYIMLTGSFPYHRQFSGNLRENILKANYNKEYLRHTSLKARLLLRDLFKVKPQERPTVSKIMRSFWFDSQPMKDRLQLFVEQVGLSKDYDTLNRSNVTFLKNISRQPKPVL